MSTAMETKEPVPAPSGTARGRWIDDWRPEDPKFWSTTGAPIARRNLIYSIFAEHVGFSVWTMWSVFVLFMGPAYGVDPAGKFLLTALPAALGSFVRLPYTFAIAKFGGRNWTVFSALMLLLPCIAAAIFLVPGTPYATMLVVACIAGVGGGNFASSMANINTLYPDRLKGWALGINAGGGNLGVAVVQLVGLAILATAGAAHPRLMLAFYIPVVVLAALGAYFRMDNISTVKNDKRAMRDVTKDGHTWIMSVLYIGTFGSFIGYSFAFGQVLQVQFKEQFASPINATYLTFLGPLIGSLIRPIGGALADRISGAKVTLAVFAAMALSAGLVLFASIEKSLPLFIIGFLSLFFFSGVGNGSTYKMIPRIFWAKAQKKIEDGTAGAEVALRDARRLSGALIGIAGAVGAFGGVLINVAFRQSFLTTKAGDAAYISFIAFYVICFAITWFVYLRPSKHTLTGV